MKLDYQMSPKQRLRSTIQALNRNSGHMQVCHPSPVAGFFEPSVALGDRIAKGAILGTVFEWEQGDTHPIVSEHDGIVLVLRTFPRVRAGESVGVVLDLTPEHSRNA